MSTIFLSYSHEDAPRAQRICQVLKKHGHDVSIDHKNTARTGSIADGDCLQKIVIDAIHQADTIVISDSPQWRESQFCQTVEKAEFECIGTRVIVVDDPILSPLELDNALHTRFTDLPEVINYCDQFTDAAQAYTQLLHILRQKYATGEERLLHTTLTPVVVDRLQKDVGKPSNVQKIFHALPAVEQAKKVVTMTTPQPGIPRVDPVVFQASKILVQAARDITVARLIAAVGFVLIMVTIIAIVLILG